MNAHNASEASSFFEYSNRGRLDCVEASRRGVEASRLDATQHCISVFGVEVSRWHRGGVEALHERRAGVELASSWRRGFARRGVIAALSLALSLYLAISHGAGWAHTRSAIIYAITCAITLLTTAGTHNSRITFTVKVFAPFSRTRAVVMARI